MKYLLITFITIIAAKCTNTTTSTAGTSKNDDTKVVISYQTGACFGSCPQFNLAISGTEALITYNSVKDTVKHGTYSKTITDSELKELVKLFDDAQFFTLDDSYLGNIVDFPINTITYSNNGKSKSIRVRSNIPKPLENIQKALQGIANSEGWKKIE